MEYADMFQYVKEMLDKDTVTSGGYKYRIGYSRFDHIRRVYKWMQRICENLDEQIHIDQEALKIATIFHDVGYGMLHDNTPHAQISETICRNYMTEKGYPSDQIDFVCYLIANHSEKELLENVNIPIELIVLLEADLLDDTGAHGIVLDTLVEGMNENTNFEKVYEHIMRFTFDEMKDSPMVTEPGRKYWKEKQDLVTEFVRQYKRDIEMDDFN
jgi:uncharacterized protein